MGNPHRKKGVSLTEYSLLAGLIATASIFSLKLLGGAIHDLFVSFDSSLKANSTLSMLADNPKNPSVQQKIAALNSKPSFQGGTITPNLKGSGYYALKADSDTGQPVLTLIDAASTEVKNATSLEGTQMNALGTFMLAQTLDELAAQQTQPELESYYREMAKLAYYMGANEGELDDISGLTQGGKYSNGDALQDLLSTQAALRDLMQNPPGGLNVEQHATLFPLAVDAFNIAQNYINHLESFIDSSGKVPKNFSALNAKGDCFASGAGISMEQDTKLTISKDPRIRGVSYENLVSYDTLKSKARNLLAKEKLTQPVQATFEDAQTLDTANQ